jgi:hypothetical protein
MNIGIRIKIAFCKVRKLKKNKVIEIFNKTGFDVCEVKLFR